MDSIRRGACEVTQERGWKFDRRYMLWVTQGRLCGALLHQNSFAGSLLDDWFPAELGDFGLWGCALMVLLLPLMLALGAARRRQERERQEMMLARLNALEPGSDAFLDWDERNFAISPVQVKGAVFTGTDGIAWTARDFQRLRLELEGGERWRFRFSNRAASASLETVLRDAGFAVSRS